MTDEKKLLDYIYECAEKMGKCTRTAEDILNEIKYKLDELKLERAKNFLPIDVHYEAVIPYNMYPILVEYHKEILHNSGKFLYKSYETPFPFLIFGCAIEFWWRNEIWVK